MEYDTKNYLVFFFKSEEKFYEVVFGWKKSLRIVYRKKHNYENNRINKQERFERLINSNLKINNNKKANFSFLS